MGNPDFVGFNPDTGDSWMDGTDPIIMTRVLKKKVHHIHREDLDKEWVAKCGTQYGCGFSTITIGDGVIDIKGVCNVLKTVILPIQHLKLLALPWF